MMGLRRLHDLNRPLILQLHILRVPIRESFKTKIINILDSADPQDDGREFSERKVSRVLNCIPSELIQLEKSKEFLKSHKEILNEPTFKSSWSSEPMTTELWLQEEGQL